MVELRSNSTGTIDSTRDARIDLVGVLLSQRLFYRSLTPYPLGRLQSMLRAKATLAGWVLLTLAGCSNEDTDKNI